MEQNTGASGTAEAFNNASWISETSSSSSRFLGQGGNAAYGNNHQLA